MQQLWTVNAIKDAVRASGSYWFDPDTMRCFGTRVLPSVYQGPGGIFFVTSDKQFDDTRGHTVRSFNPDGAKVGTASELATLTRADAIQTAKLAAGGAGTHFVEVAQDFREITIDFAKEGWCVPTSENNDD